MLNNFYNFQVWVTFQDNIIHYLKNSLLLPLVIRSNRTISKYFVGYDTTISSLKFDGRYCSSIASPHNPFLHSDCKVITIIILSIHLIKVKAYPPLARQSTPRGFSPPSCPRSYPTWTTLRLVRITWRAWESAIARLASGLNTWTYWPWSIAVLSGLWWLGKVSSKTPYLEV